MLPNQIKFLKRILLFILGLFVLWFIFNHIIGFLITVVIIIVIAGLIGKFAPNLLELIDNVKDFFSK